MRASLLIVPILGLSTSVKASGPKKPEDVPSGGRLSLKHCTEQIKTDGFVERSINRRSMVVQDVVGRGNGLGARSLSRLLNTSHESYDTFDLNVTAKELFDSDTFHSCVLTPEVTEGPFYIEGEYVRQDVWENQPGVPLYLDIQILDTSTCKPVPNGVFVEIWSANATGHYGAHNETFLRGLQPTDNNGSVAFGTMFPGHYYGRTNHLHIMTHLNATMLENGTVYGNTATYCGQLFFDQDLIDRVELYIPYAFNPWSKTPNIDDVFLAEQAENNSDPFIEWIWLEHYGVLGWIILGVDMSTVREISVSGTHG